MTRGETVAGEQAHRLTTRRGFLFSLDALLALLVLFIVLSTAYSQLATVKRSAWADAGLSQTGADTLAVLAKSGRLTAALNGNSSAAYYVIGYVPSGVCAQLRIFNASDNQQMLISKANCGNRTGPVRIARRTFIYNGNPMWASLEAWYK